MARLNPVDPHCVKALRRQHAEASFGTMRSLILPLLVLGLAQPVWAQSDTGADPTAEDTVVAFGAPEPVVIDTGDSRHTVMAELAVTPEQMQRGLMWRETVPVGTGMLFHYVPAQRAAMWMENTLADLDLLFIDESGEVVKVIAYAQAGSRRSLPANAEVSGVLELAAGQAIEMGIRPGDSVHHAIFGNAELDALDDTNETGNDAAAEDGADDTP